MTDPAPSFPAGPVRRWLLAKSWLLICVAAPGLLATLYYAAIAADVFVSETRFIMRTAHGASTSGGVSNIVLPMELSSLTRANDEAHLVNTYLTSRDAMARLIDDDGFLDVVARPEADFLARFPRPWDHPTRERLHLRLSDFVTVTYETTTGISTLSVHAFRPDDAQRIATALLVSAEALVNRLNVRARADAIRFASDVVEKAEQRVAVVQSRLTEFRNQEMVLDPAKQSVAALELVAALLAEAAQLKTVLAETLASAPDSPRVAALRVRLQAIDTQIAEQRTGIAGGDGSLASKLADYEKLVLERELATKALTSALATLEQARQDGQRQQLYLERIVEPHLPDFPAGPARLLSVLTAVGLGLCVYLIVSTLGRWIWEHDG